MRPIRPDLIVRGFQLRRSAYQRVQLESSETRKWGTGVSDASSRLVSRLQRQILDPVGRFFWSSRLGKNFEIIDRSSDCYGELVSVDHPGEMPAGSLPHRRLGEEIFVLTEKNATQIRRSVEQAGIIQIRCSVELRRDHIDSPKQKPTRDRGGHVNVHVEPDAHASLPNSRNRFLIGDSADSARNLSALLKLLWIRASIST